MKQVFLDANIFLDFYRFGPDDISEIAKLIVLAQDQEIILYTNGLLKEEIKRNREKVLFESFQEMSRVNFPLRVPNYCNGMEELQTLKDSIKATKLAQQDLVRATKERIDRRSLEADRLIEELINVSEAIELSEKILLLARERFDKGNPPGKKSRPGDEIHWEALLSIGSGFDFHIISRDGDFFSEFGGSEIKNFLKDEWGEVFTSVCSVHGHKSLSEFLKLNFPQIELSAEEQKNELIDQLSSSPSFFDTHSLIAELDKFDFFTNAQVRRLFSILVQNSQVSWIASDQDVKEFFLQFQNKSHLVPREVRDLVPELLQVNELAFYRIPF